MFTYKRSTLSMLLSAVLLLSASFSHAQIAATNKISDVRGTKHNLSASDTYVRNGQTLNAPARTVKATTETQVCVFCHTPHGANTEIAAPLWNRALSTATYTPTYTSTSIEADAAELAAGPGGSSKLCLSCHDGTMAIDKVNVLNGAQNVTIAMTGTNAGKMPDGSGATTGFTRNLGTNLSNDHPISFTYNSTLATRDGELRTPVAENTIGGVVMNRAQGKVKPVMPLEAGKMQCATCHDPHLRDTTTGNGNAKFLRVNRFQVDQPSGVTFSQTNDIICLACHDKGGLSWAYSAHANKQVATQTYKSAAATTREFPINGANGPPVWQVACLNCHDTHTVQGARRLLREGTDSASTPKAGGNAALEETCYQCHSNSSLSAVNYTANTSNAVPDIKTDFSLARHMPITSSEQAAGTEVHDIGGIFSDGTDADCNNTSGVGKCGKDLLESRAKLGVGNLNNRHAECSDCHNPHRVVKFRDFRGSGGNIAGTPDAAGTHSHTDTAMNHTNIASGVLRGSWGVEPTYSSKSFQSLPSGYDVKRGDPGTSNSSLVTEKFVTREYQICLKCHSDYAYIDNNIYPTGSRPNLGYTGGTPSGTNNLTQYTNQAKEFQAPTTHKGEVTTADSGASASYSTNNHRGWHPVMDSTGRTTSIRNANASNWNAPWSNAVGTQTMYCSDCHGSNTGSGTAIPSGGDNGSPWGPHGSSNNFVLKGTWDGNSGNGDSSSGLCFKCHSYDKYATKGGGSSGFGGSKDSNLHSYHADKIGKMRCSWCHVAVPHGWKNKALLVNLNDVGPEAGLTAGTQVRNNTTTAYNNGPYYMNARLKVKNFKSSGNWTEADCGSSGAPGNGDSGRSWMRDSNENCKSPP